MSHLADLLAESHDGGNGVGRRLSAADVFEQFHVVGGYEEVRAHYPVGPMCARRDFVDVERGRIRTEYRVPFTSLVQFGEHLLFQRHVLENGFDDLSEKQGQIANEVNLNCFVD